MSTLPENTGESPGRKGIGGIGNIQGARNGDIQGFRAEP